MGMCDFSRLTLEAECAYGRRCSEDRGPCTFWERGRHSSLSLRLTWACLGPSTVVFTPSYGLPIPTPLLDPAPNPRENPNRVEAPLPCTGKETEA